MASVLIRFYNSASRRSWILATQFMQRHPRRMPSDADAIFHELYQTTDELRQASRAIDTAYDRLQSLRDNLISFADRLQTSQSLSPSPDDEHEQQNVGLANVARSMQQNMSDGASQRLSNSSSNASSSSRRRRVVHPSSSNPPHAGGSSSSIHTRRSMLESHLRSIRRLLDSDPSFESTTSLGRRVTQRIISPADSDQANEDNLSRTFSQNSSPPSRIESRAAAAHLRLSFLPNPTIRSTNHRNGSPLTRTRPVRSNSLTALPPSTTLPSSQLSPHTSGRSNESAARMFDDFVRTYWPQRQDLEPSDAAVTLNMFTSDSEDSEVDHRSSRSWTSSQTPDTNDTAIFDPVFRNNRQTRGNSAGSFNSNGDDTSGIDSTQPGRTSTGSFPGIVIQHVSVEANQSNSSKMKIRERKTASEKAIILKRLFESPSEHSDGMYGPLPGRLSNTRPLYPDRETNRTLVNINTSAGR